MCMETAFTSVLSLTQSREGLAESLEVLAAMLYPNHTLEDWISCSGLLENHEDASLFSHHCWGLPHCSVLTCF